MEAEKRILRLSAAIAAVGLVVGFSSVPLLFTLGLLPAPPANARLAAETAAAATPPEQVP